MITVKIDEQTAVEMLLERLSVWTQDETAAELYRKMYENYAESGVFDGGEFDVMAIVDNDWVNWCRIIDESDGEEYEQIKQLYSAQGLGDISCDCEYASYIEAVDDEENPTAFLIRA